MDTKPVENGWATDENVNVKPNVEPKNEEPIVINVNKPKNGEPIVISVIKPKNEEPIVIPTVDVTEHKNSITNQQSTPIINIAPQDKKVEIVTPIVQIHDEKPVNTVNTVNAVKERDHADVKENVELIIATKTNYIMSVMGNYKLRSVTNWECICEFKDACTKIEDDFVKKFKTFAYSKLFDEYYGMIKFEITGTMQILMDKYKNTEKLLCEDETKKISSMIDNDKKLTDLKLCVQLGKQTNYGVDDVFKYYYDYIEKLSREHNLTQSGHELLESFLQNKHIEEVAKCANNAEFVREYKENRSELIKKYNSEITEKINEFSAFVTSFDSKQDTYWLKLGVEINKLKKKYDNIEIPYNSEVYHPIQQLRDEYIESIANIYKGRWENKLLEIKSNRYRELLRKLVVDGFVEVKKYTTKDESDEDSSDDESDESDSDEDEEMSLASVDKDDIKKKIKIYDLQQIGESTSYMTSARHDILKNITDKCQTNIYYIGQLFEIVTDKVGKTKKETKVVQDKSFISSYVQMLHIKKGIYTKSDLPSYIAWNDNVIDKLFVKQKYADSESHEFNIYVFDPSESDILCKYSKIIDIIDEHNAVEKYFDIKLIDMVTKLLEKQSV